MRAGAGLCIEYFDADSSLAQLSRKEQSDRATAHDNYVAVHQLRLLFF